MPRPFWKGSISFGLVEIPVTLHRATESQELDLTMVDRKNFSPVGYRRYNKTTGEEVPWERIVRGYEYEPDEYVVLTDEDLKRANVEASQTIEIVTFVQRDDIDPMFYETPYYIEPLKRGSKSYTLLREALDRSGKIGIAKVVLRVRQHLAALIVRGEALVLDLLRYPHEIRSAEGLSLPSQSQKQLGITAKELQMAQQLIDGMSDSWKPASYKDEYYDDLMALIERRVREGKTHTIDEAATPARSKRATEVVDLMALLKQSLEKRTGGPARAKRAGTNGRVRGRGERRRTRSA